MILLDTHVVVWLALQPQLLSARAVEALEAATATGGLAIAGCSLWEVALLHTRGRIILDAPLDEFLHRLEKSYVVLPLNRQIAVRGVQFSTAFPRDPADKQIAATALLHSLQLVTADARILASGEVPCIW